MNRSPLDFIFSLYDDRALVERLIFSLRAIYPDANLICISDGVNPDGFAEFAAKHDVTYIVGEQRLKPARFGGQWIERMFEAALLHSNAPCIVRTEGDARFWRRFNYLPAAEVAGALSMRHGFPFPNGPCWVLRRSAIQKILSSGILRQPIYAESPWFRYERYDKFRYADEPKDSTPILLEDVVLGHVAKQLGLSISPFLDVAIKFRGEPADNSTLAYAVTHPHR